MNSLLYVFLALPVVIGVYAYVGYPMLLGSIAKSRQSRKAKPQFTEWPFLTITVPCYNEAKSIRQTLESLLALEYPAGRRQIVVISDASTDGTDDIVREFVDRGVDLVRLETRRGKSAAENAAGAVIKGEIVVNTDATIKILPNALKALVAAFADPTVGVASGRDVSVTREEIQARIEAEMHAMGGTSGFHDASPHGGVNEAIDGAATRGTSSITNASNDVATNGTTLVPPDASSPSGESGYVGYEMKIRGLETQVGSIVGASGCFYGIRTSLYDSGFPESLSRDFASALMAREGGYRAVSVDEAVCLVPRTTSLESEFRRKIRTMARGLQTLWFKRHLLNPFRHGSFAWMLFSHKLCRWLVYPALILAAVSLVILATRSTFWLIILIFALLGSAIGWIGMRWPKDRPAPALLTLAGFALASNLAGILAWLQVLRNKRAAVWEPTRR